MGLDATIHDSCVEWLKAVISGLGDPKVQAVLHDDVSSSFSEG